jgi:serine/threonine-protein kinase
LVGKTLGRYEIFEPLGAGGMGEVYRARDTALKRDVAIKVLPQEFITDEESLARLEREAHLLASLNHPNIATIHSLEKAEGSCFLVLELVKGESLEQRLAKGALPVEKALDVGRQIAAALEAAHGEGVIHRDLKPANVLVTPEGRAKVLDFGIAKSMRVDAAVAATARATNLTVAGTLVGTPSYMSPEQVRGEVVDKRADIWAFGCLLFETLTARSAFAKETMADTLAAIVDQDPEWSALPKEIPRQVRRLIKRCLRKDAQRRLRDVGDARIELEEALSEPLADVSVGAHVPTASSSRLALGLGGVAAGLLIGLMLAFQFGAGGGLEDSARVGPPTAGEVRLADDAPIAYGVAAIGYDKRLIDVSPQGEWLVYVGKAARGSMLYRKSLRDHEPARPLDGTEGAIYAFFSPDGETIGFLTDEQLKRISIGGDDLRTVTNVRAADYAKWTEDDWIYFDQSGDFLSRVKASRTADVENVPLSNAGGTVTDISTDGTMALYSVATSGISHDYSAVHLVDLASGSDTVVLESAYGARFAPTGHLVFGRGGDLLAVRFDSETRKPLGEPMTVVRNVAMDSLFGGVQAAFSANGTLVYLTGGDRAIAKIVTVDRQGEERFLPTPPRVYGVLDLSPDDTRLAYQIADVNDAILMHEIGEGDERELTRGDIGGWPVWNPQSDAIAYISGRRDQAERDLKILPLGQSARTVIAGPFDWISDWSSNGEIGLQSWNVGIRSVGFWSSERPTDVEWVESPDAVLWGLAFSPDGRHVAYASNETGQYEVWVRPREEGSNARQVSFNGGMAPVWCACNEIFFRRGNQFFSAVVSPGADLEWGTPQLVFEVPDFIDTSGISYDISSDGQLLYTMKRAEATIDGRIHLISNWYEELKRLVPTSQ